MPQQVDSSFAVEVTVKFTGEQTQKVWNTVSFSDNGMSPAEVKAWIGGTFPKISGALVEHGLQNIDAGVASGEISSQ